MMASVLWREALRSATKRFATTTRSWLDVAVEGGTKTSLRAAATILLRKISREVQIASGGLSPAAAKVAVAL